MQSPSTAHRPVYLTDLYDPRGLISKVYFRYLALLFLVAPIFVFFGVPTLLAPTVADDAPALADDPSQQEMVIYCYYFVTLVLLYLLVVVCINRLRMAGRSGWWLLVPGYNVWLLFVAEDVVS